MDTTGGEGTLEDVLIQIHSCKTLSMLANNENSRSIYRLSPSVTPRPLRLNCLRTIIAPWQPKKCAPTHRYGPVSSYEGRYGTGER